MSKETKLDIAALPHSEHKGWDSLFDNVAAVRDAQYRPLAAKERL